jgi:crossover junction endodeoxyribonuclease RuvC
MLILGIDPGTAMMGWGVINLDAPFINPFTSQELQGKRAGRKTGISYVAHGAIKTSSSMPMPARLLHLRRQFLEIVSQHNPVCVVVEKLFFGRNVQTAMSVERARGVVMVTAAELGMPFFEYQALSVKKILSGSGKSDKNEMEKAVARFLDLKKLPKPNDAADALAIAVCHALRGQGGETKIDLGLSRDVSGRFLKKTKKGKGKKG